ncbi:MAG: glycerol kinase 5 [Candidatus Hodarchaeales archaeon]
MKYILAIDAGSTGIRSVLINKEGRIIHYEYEPIKSIKTEQGCIEYDPEDLWHKMLFVVRRLFEKSGVKAGQVLALGITNQRGCFTLWDKNSGKALTNFISWADVRASNTCDQMNRSKVWRLLKRVSWLLGRVTGNQMFQTTSLLDFTTDHVTVRLKWVLESNPDLKEKSKKGEVLFGTIDTWFIYKLTHGKVHATDYSNAATGLLNPFHLVWNRPLLKLFNIPTKMLPELKETSDDYGKVDPSIFGFEIPIKAAVGDQQSALFAQCCFEPGDVKVSQGSGAFVDMNVGFKAKLSRRGLFPLVAWVINGQPSYLLEGYVATAGTLIDWLGQGLGLSDTPKALNDFASQCDSSKGVIFVPTPSGIRFPYFNPNTKASIFGLSLTTHRKHVARAVFEGIALRIVDILIALEKDTKIPIRSIKTDGGVSRSDIMLQILSDLANLTVKRAPETDMTATGAAYLAGLAIGFWRDRSELQMLYDKMKPTIFEPKMDGTIRKAKIQQWEKALQSVLSIES